MICVRILSLITIYLLTIACSKPSAQHEQLEPIPATLSEIDTTQTEKVNTYNFEVYITNEGDKYHTVNCRYSKTAYPVKVSKAKADGKKACDVCNPSSTTGKKQQRCSAKTAEGKQCQRMTSNANGQCFQHQ
jgi:flagellar basal body rod protein FlgC